MPVSSRRPASIHLPTDSRLVLSTMLGVRVDIAARLQPLVDQLVARGYSARDDNMLALQHCGGNLDHAVAMLQSAQQAETDEALRASAEQTGAAMEPEPEPAEEDCQRKCCLEIMCDGATEGLQYCRRCSIEKEEPTWICEECQPIHFKMTKKNKVPHTLALEPPPPPFWEQLNKVASSSQTILVEVNVAIAPGEEPRARCKVPDQVLLQQGKRATTQPTPVISFVGGTGAGKSFLVSALMARSGTPSNQWPAVAEPDQAAPTSSHVRFFRGQMATSGSATTDRAEGVDAGMEGASSPTDTRPVLFLDLEGEDGDVPISLQDKSMALVNSLLSQATIPREQADEL